MSDLSRINVITGKNNVGKTSLLEALFLHAGYYNPDLVLRLNTWRGLESFALEPEALWGWLFHNHETEADIHISTESTENKRADVCIALREPEVSTIGQGDLSGIGNSSGDFASATSGQTKRLICSYSLDGEVKGVSESWIQGSEIKTSKGKEYGPDASFVNSRTIGGKRYAQRLSKLNEFGRGNEVVEPGKVLEPRIQSLEILVQGEAIIAADIGLKRKIPVSYMGEGVSKILSIILSILSYPNGYVLIDEIENGFHYSVLEKVWKTIAKASRQSNTQVFATTHSKECIEAAYVAFGETGEEDYGVQRLEGEDEQTRAVRLDRETFETTVEAGLEIR